jgi:outer membrane protein assembly factor BamA
MGNRTLFFICFIFASGKTLFAQEKTDYLKISAIHISGNKHTKESVILRELPFTEGDTLIKEVLRTREARAEQLILNTSLFNTVSVSDSVHGNQADIYIHVKERFPIEPSAHFAIADRNFNAWWQDRQLYRTLLGGGLTHRNFRGLNQRLGFDATIGWRQSIALMYRVPYINRRQTIGLATNLYYLNGQELGVITEQNRLKYLRDDSKNIIRKIGGDLSFTYRPRLVVRHSIRLGYEYYAIDDTVARFRNPEYLGEGRDELRITRVAYIFSVDHRDNVAYPWEGNYFIGAIDQKGSPFGGTDVNIQTLELNYRHFIAIKPRFSLGAGFRTVMNRPDTLPYLLRSSLGYRYQVRGFEYYVLDGYNFFLFTSELRYRAYNTKFHFPWVPIEGLRTVPLTVMAKVFYDQGYVSYPEPVSKGGNDLLNRWLRGWGAGLDFLSFYDKILRVEYSFNSLRQSGLFLHYIEAF